MQDGLLRKIDFWVGVPLCFVLTGVDWVRRLLRPRPLRANPVRKILVIKMAELGAIILAYPLLTALRRNYPAGDIHVLTFQKNKEVFDLLDGIVKPEHILTIDDTSAWSMLTSLGRLCFGLWRERFDIVIDLEFFSRIGAVVTCAAAAPVTAGFYSYGFEGLSRGELLTHKVAYNPLQHASVNFYAMSTALKLPDKKSPELLAFIDAGQFTFPAYTSDPSVRARLNRFGIPDDKQVFLMNAGEGVIPLREWPLTYFVDVARHIIADDRNVLVLVGGGSAGVKAREMKAVLASSRVIDCTGQTSMPELMEVFLRSRAVIANDCGLMHLAMLTPIPKIVLFGPESPQIFRPLGPNVHVLYSHWPCSPCLSVLNHRVSHCRDNVCLKEIRPAQVIAVLNSVTAKT